MRCAASSGAFCCSPARGGKFRAAALARDSDPYGYSSTEAAGRSSKDTYRCTFTHDSYKIPENAAHATNHVISSSGAPSRSVPESPPDTQKMLCASGNMKKSAQYKGYVT